MQQAAQKTAGTANPLGSDNAQPLENQGEQSRVQKHLKVVPHGFVLAMLLVSCLGASILGHIGGSVVHMSVCPSG